MKYYGQFDPQVDKLLHNHFFSNKFNGISIECGAFDGITESCTKFFEENYNWKTINIEAGPLIFKKLQKNRPNSINLEIALSNSNEISIFTNYKHPHYGYNWGNGSINHTFEHKKILEQTCGKNNFVELQVQCKTYKQIIEDLQIDHLDLFILDVEGNELQVIEGMIDCDILPDVFVIEIGHINQNEVIEKLKLLKSSYKFEFTSFVNSFFTRIK
jgi:FkbM family methyltransferase